MSVGPVAIDSELLRKIEKFLEKHGKEHPSYPKEYYDATLPILIYDFIKWHQSSTS